MNERVGVVLLNLGGPDSLDDVEGFLYGIFSDPLILEFPWYLSWVRNPLARYIARKRAPEASENYRKLGGKSPINEATAKQAAALQTELVRRGYSDAVVEFGQRASRPRTDVAAAKLKEAKIARGVILPLYPQYARPTTLSGLEDFERAWRDAGGEALGTRWKTVRSYPDHPAYVAAIAGAMRKEIEKIPAEKRATTALLFSAHGLPVKQARHPDESYEQEVRRTVAAVLKALDWKGRWHLGFQSRVGPLKWLEPATETVIDTMVAEGTTDAVVYPVAFVSDHSETLYELDMLYGDAARAKGLAWRRVLALNDDPAFIAALADLVEEKLKASSP